MSAGWDDFEESSSKCREPRTSKLIPVPTTKTSNNKEQDDGTSCDWGFSRQEAQAGDKDLESSNTETSKFTSVYERYLEDKKSIVGQTRNTNLFSNNPQKALRDWFDNEGHEFSINTEQPRENEYTCSLDLPICEHDFTLTSDVHKRKQHAIDEVCLAACSLLDETQLLYTWESNTKEDPDKKRRLDEANKEDDIELDCTKTKRVCGASIKGTPIKTTTTSTVNTYESLMARWSELSRTILLLKADLVKLDLSITKHPPPTKDTSRELSINKPQETGDGLSDDDSEPDPLDEFMSSLETKTKFSMEDKIEKSRIKTEIAAFEREQEEVSRLIELAKPKFDLNKVCPRS